MATDTRTQIRERACRAPISELRSRCKALLVLRKDFTVDACLVQEAFMSVANLGARLSEMFFQRDNYGS